MLWKVMGDVGSCVCIPSHIKIVLIEIIMHQPVKLTGGIWIFSSLLYLDWTQTSTGTQILATNMIKMKLYKFKICSRYSME